MRIGEERSRQFSAVQDRLKLYDIAISTNKCDVGMHRRQSRGSNLGILTSCDSTMTVTMSKLGEQLWFKNRATLPKRLK
jgi:hypothetical protein